MRRNIRQGPHKTLCDAGTKLISAGSTSLDAPHADRLRTSSSSALVAVFTHLFCVSKHDNGSRDSTGVREVLVLEHAQLHHSSRGGCMLNGD